VVAVRLGGRKPKLELALTPAEVRALDHSLVASTDLISEQSRRIEELELEVARLVALVPWP
jgi:hypothetical protein